VYYDKRVIERKFALQVSFVFEPNMHLHSHGYVISSYLENDSKLSSCSSDFIFSGQVVYILKISLKTVRIFFLTVDYECV
jgi:hypothetical protein